MLKIALKTHFFVEFLRLFRDFFVTLQLNSLRAYGNTAKFAYRHPGL